MSFRKHIIAAAIVAAVVPAAFAAGDLVWVGGETGYQEVQRDAQALTRGQVGTELQSFRSAQVAADGSTWVGGEAGWVPHQHSYMMANGMRMHTGTLSIMGNARAPLQPAAPFAPAGGVYDKAGG